MSEQIFVSGKKKKEMTAKSTLQWLHIVKKKGSRIVLQSPLLLGASDCDAWRMVCRERGLAFAVHSTAKWD